MVKMMLKCGALTAMWLMGAFAVASLAFGFGMMLSEMVGAVIGDSLWLRLVWVMGFSWVVCTAIVFLVKREE